MEDTSGFYKNDDGYVLVGPNFVLNANYELRKETKTEHTYPTDGWYWFDSAEEAYTFFGLTLPKNGE
jgi:hypothetical protein